jgi:hypothetical protein
MAILFEIESGLTHVVLVVDVAKWFFDSASDLAKQLIVVSTGVLGLSITFLKDVVKVNPEVKVGFLISSWFLYLLSIIFGFATLMAVTGSIWNLLEDQNGTPVVSKIRLLAGLQIGLFLVGTLCLIAYGMGAVKKLAQKPQPPPVRKGSLD